VFRPARGRAAAPARSLSSGITRERGCRKREGVGLMTVSQHRPSVCERAQPLGTPRPPFERLCTGTDPLSSEHREPGNECDGFMCDAGTWGRERMRQPRFGEATSRLFPRPKKLWCSCVTADFPVENANSPDGTCRNGDVGFLASVTIRQSETFCCPAHTGRRRKLLPRAPAPAPRRETTDSRRLQPTIIRAVTREQRSANRGFRYGPRSPGRVFIAPARPRRSCAFGPRRERGRSTCHTSRQGKRTPGPRGNSIPIHSPLSRRIKKKTRLRTNAAAPIAPALTRASKRERGNVFRGHGLSNDVVGLVAPLVMRW